MFHLLPLDFAEIYLQIISEEINNQKNPTDQLVPF